MKVLRRRVVVGVVIYLGWVERRLSFWSWLELGFVTDGSVLVDFGWDEDGGLV